jgi:cob(I)alamin adenosyltransferase
MSSKVKIYTRTGDSGKTSLIGGIRIPKYHLRIETCGVIDELNSFLGIALNYIEDKEIEGFIKNIQKTLFLICSNIAGAKTGLSSLSDKVGEMELLIDKLDSKLPELRNFILPTGTEGAVFCFFARAIARRAERILVSLSEKEILDSRIIVYFNRLSDLLFVIGRYQNHLAGFPENIWKNQ